MSWKTVRIFISSTFNDMHAERDYLVKNVFPDLAEWCEARRLRLVDIDLRWGVTTADSQANNTVLACLQNIDDSRPFFLCFLGQRRGWVPGGEEVSAATLQRYPGAQAYVGKASVTEMEIEHALLAPMERIANGQADVPVPVSHALFFFRDNPFKGQLSGGQQGIYTNAAQSDPAAADAALKQFKRKVRKSWRYVSDYQCRWDEAAVTPELLDEGEDVAQGRLTGFCTGGVTLKEAILSQLKEEIEKEFPDHKPAAALSALDKELEQQEQFIEQSAEGFIPRAGDFDALDGYLKSDSDSIFVLAAKAGLGKTMLLANYTRRLRAEGKKVYARFCGASDQTADAYSLFKSIFEQAGVEAPPTLEEMKSALPGLFARLDGVVIIDAVNQLPGGAAMLAWLPEKLPDGLKLIVSLKEDSGAGEARLKNEKRFHLSFLQPFQTDEEKEKLINAYLEHYFKHLDEEHIRAICDIPGSQNPLFMKILLSELRVFGAFRQLRDEIEKFGQTPVQAFGAVLARLEKDAADIKIAPGEMVSALFGLLGCARKGLSESELVCCLSGMFPGIARDDAQSAIRFYIRQVRPFMARRAGRVDFLYESFKIASQERYKANEPVLQGSLASCFRSFADPDGDGSYMGEDTRVLEEYAYHLLLHDRQSGEELYRDVPYLTARCSCSPVALLLEEYGRLTGEAQKSAGEYRELIFRYKQALAKYPASLPSLLYYTCSLPVRDRVLAAQSDGRLKRVWLKADGVDGAALPPQAGGEGGGLTFRKISEAEFDLAAAVALAGEADIAFHTVGRGRIGVTDTKTLSAFAAVIDVSAKNILNIVSSPDGTYLAVGFDDGTADIVRLGFEGANLSINLLGSIEYMLPEGMGVFAFEGDALWYQDSGGDLVRMCLNDGTKQVQRFDIPGEVTSALVFGGILCYATWQRSKAVLTLRSVPNGSVIATREFESDDLLVMTHVDGGFVVASMRGKPDYAVYVLDHNLQEIAAARLPIPAAAACAHQSGLLLLPRMDKSKLVYLWDYAAGSAPTEGRQIFKFLDQVFLKANADGTLAIISNLALAKFVITQGAGSGIGRVLGLADTGNGVVTVLEDAQGGLAVCKNAQTASLCAGAGQRNYMVMFADEKGAILSDTGQGFEFSYDAVQNVRSFTLDSFPLAAALAQDGTVYYYDTGGRLGCGSRAPSVDLSGYLLNTVKLYSLGGYIVLTGVAQNAQAVTQMAPYIIMFFRPDAQGRLKKLGERSFAVVHEPIESVCFDTEKEVFYVFFEKAAVLCDTHQPTVFYGGMDALLHGNEKETQLNCPRRELSALVAEGRLCVCSEGRLTVHNVQDMAYESAFFQDEPVRQLAQGHDGRSLLAVIGDADVVRITIVNK